MSERVSGPREPKAEPWTPAVDCSCEGAAELAEEMWVCSEHGECAVPELASVIREVTREEGITKELAWRMVLLRRRAGGDGRLPPAILEAAL